MEKLDVRTKVAVVGLGYVGLPLAVAFAELFPLLATTAAGRKSNATGRDGM